MIVFLSLIALLAAWGIVATVQIARRDGYRAVPDRPRGPQG
ncbi:hypothetical protein EV379_0201 [Microterricola gilva]|uniref:Uncharacterized protein n=1 Tax=Microterricola gilva TaxID=393267 RepID=A0A4Q8AHP1_9MICO|nr:hypothetical protein [Microterricola gilva]RZU63912.1 hypothetical protein EV379_0201 [Microterricola gilva]